MVKYSYVIPYREFRMLTQLTISNFAIVRELEIDFQRGMTAITGETGAGKSIAIDALGLCLGGRSEAAMVRLNTPRADICARFSLADTPQRANGLNRTSWMTATNACSAALSAPMAARGVLLTAPRFPFHSCVS